MEEKIHHGITMERWMDRTLSGENIENKEIGLVATIKDKDVNIYSKEELGDKVRRKMWEHARDVIVCPTVNYVVDSVRYDEWKKKWDYQCDNFFEILGERFNNL